MNSRIYNRRIRLIDALTSGKYTKGTNYLRSGDTYCCLGVACDIVSPTLGTWVSKYGQFIFRPVDTNIHGSDAYLPAPVMEYYDLSSATQSDLSDMNDGEEGTLYSHEEIAAYIYLLTLADLD